MILLLGATAISLAALQATINAPTSAFKSCLSAATSKAKSDNVAPDAYEAYVREACSAQLTDLRSALISFDVKNGVSRKNAAQNADMTVQDYVGTSVDKYQFLAKALTPTVKSADVTPQPTPTAAPQPTPASAPQPPKP